MFFLHEPRSFPVPAANLSSAAGKEVVLRGFGTTCTEYLLSGVGVPCFCTYDWSNHSQIISQPDNAILQAMLGYLTQKEGVLPVVRVPLTAAYWLNVNVPSTYPDLGGQYRTLISRIVEFWTTNNVAVILDLHWNDDSSKQQPMALKGSASAIDFWSAVAPEPVVRKPLLA